MTANQRLEIDALGIAQLSLRVMQHGGSREGSFVSCRPGRKWDQVRSWLLSEKAELKSMAFDAEEFIPSGAGRAGQTCRSG